MQDLLSQLSRLYLLDGQMCFEDDARDHPLPLSTVRLEQHLLGVNTVSLALLTGSTAAVGSAGATDSGRTMLLDFSAGGPPAGAQQWRALCALANGLRDDLRLPAPAVAISGHGFQLWLSLERPAPAARLAEFAALLRRAFLPEEAGNNGLGGLLTIGVLPPARHAGGKWSAFIHPGMGASFAEEPALEMAPPVGAQVGFLEGLTSMTPAQFDEAVLALRARVGHDMQSGVQACTQIGVQQDVQQGGQAVAPTPVEEGGPDSKPQAAATGHSPSADSLLLRDASLEDIVRHLHALHIEPTFRYLLPGA